jgi:hypothetical protein
MNVGELESAKRRALNLFDAWNQITGVVTPGTSYYAEIQACIEDAVECGAQAATGDFKRLNGEDGPIAGAPTAIGDECTNCGMPLPIGCSGHFKEDRTCRLRANAPKPGDPK